MRIVHVASEVAPWAETGGLGQVAGALPAALARAGAEVAVVAPLYRGVRDRAAAHGVALVERGVVEAELAGRTWQGRVLEARHEGVTLAFVDCPALYDRDGIYGEGGVDYPDNGARFGFLARAAVGAARHAAGGAPDIVHCHDWQAGLVPAYLAAASAGGAPRPRTVFTIHNLAFQGLLPKEQVPALGLSWDDFGVDGFEFWGQLSLLKAGCAADAITTVSPTYAREVLTPAFGCGLEAFLAARGVTGILNGIDTAVWDPATDAAIAAPYALDRMAGKAAARRALGDELGLAPGGLLCGVVSRLTAQKGIDLAVELADQLPALDARLVVLGLGERGVEDALRRLAAARPSHVAVSIGFDQDRARRIFAGSDALLMPSRFEPCGLAQMQAMRYGTLPIVNPVGGLGDTVEDDGRDGAEHRGNGFRMATPDAAGLARAVARAAALHRVPAAWSRAVAAAMARDWSWTTPARAYLALYERVLRTPSRG